MILQKSINEMQVFDNQVHDNWYIFDEMIALKGDVCVVVIC